MKRIPLWLDLRHIAADERGPFLDAAQVAHCEAIVGADVDYDDGRLLRAGSEIGRWISIRSGRDQKSAAEHPGLVVIEGGDWTIIPLENLIAARRDRPGTLYAVAASPEETARFRDILDLGVHGIVLRPKRPKDVRAAQQILEAKGPRLADAPGDATGLDLVTGRVTLIEDAGSGDRVCIDATTVFEPGEGVLVGSTARAFVLVHAETVETEYVRARPFRVNAGAVHSYVIASGGKTHYLSELRSGHRIVAVDAKGHQRDVTVGRVKIERRPHSLVRWEAPSGPGHLVAQTAETIRFVRPDGAVVAITDLKPGDEILVHAESAARHFGMPVVEALEER